MNTNYSDIDLKRKKKFLCFLLIYLIGFFLLSLIGEKINQDGYLLMAFFAPFTVLVGVIGIAWTFYSGSD